ncbi:MAG TPA: malectin [Phycisphaerae bacterium]|nr:malectin [Phycisphaerae bacterium]
MRVWMMALLAAALLVGVTGCGPTHVFRVNCGADGEYVDGTGAKWLADKDLTEKAPWGADGGLTVERVGLSIPNCPRPKLYLAERYNMKAYQFSLENGTYDVRLHFAETYKGHTKPGQRVFSVKINGEMKVKDLDVLKEAGGFAKPLVKECKGIVVTDGKLKIEFVEGVQNPEINAIEILAY